MRQEIWRPERGAAEGSAMARFARQVGFDPADYAGMHAWSISDLNGFWSEIWDFCGVIGDKGDLAFVPDQGARMTGSRFFPKARLNIAENYLKGLDTDLVVIEIDEDGNRQDMSRDQLRAEVARIARGLRAAGVTVGDMVGTLLPNRVECLVTQLAVLSIGAIWTSCSPDFGATAILDRIGQVEPRVLVLQGQVRYGGKTTDLADRLAEVGMQSLQWNR